MSATLYTTSLEPLKRVKWSNSKITVERGGSEVERDAQYSTAQVERPAHVSGAETSKLLKMDEGSVHHVAKAVHLGVNVAEDKEKYN